jgi:hypothetical protein
MLEAERFIPIILVDYEHAKPTPKPTEKLTTSPKEP